MSKWSAFKTLATSIAFGKFGKAKLPTSRIDSRRLSIDEIKEMIMEEFKKAKDVEDIKTKEAHFSDAELENEINWVKALDLKEYFNKKNEKK